MRFPLYPLNEGLFLFLLYVEAFQKLFRIKLLNNNNTFFRNEGDGPIKNVHEIRKNKWMWGVIELLNIDHIVFKFDDCSFVIINITIVGSRKDCNN